MFLDLERSINLIRKRTIVSNFPARWLVHLQRNEIGSSRAKMITGKELSDGQAQ
jgi:hypothetical protein